jgi:hypothetical protein
MVALGLPERQPSMLASGGRRGTPSAREISLYPSTPQLAVTGPPDVA